MSEPFPTPPGGVTLEQLQQLKRVREASLLRQWTAGKRKLSPQEMAEIAHILPPALLANPPPPAAKYLHPLDHYACEIGYDYRNIKRWVALGKKARLLCPLDEPEKLADWWEEMKRLGHFRTVVPPRVLDYVAKVAPAAAPPPSLPSQPVPGSDKKSSGNQTPPATTDTTKKINFDDLTAVGLEGARNELTLQLSAAQQELRDARAEGLSELTIQRRQKTFDATLDSLRKTEKAYHELQVARGDLAPKAEFRAEMVTLITTLRGMKRKLADNVCRVLSAALTPEHLGLVRAAITAAGEREEKLLRSASHWKRDADGNTLVE